MDDNPVPSEMVADVSSQVSSRTVDYGKQGDDNLSGYLSKPSKDSTKLPSILVIHEWWGLNDNIRSMADQLAAEGYVALAVDLYNGSVAEKPEQARKMMSAVGKDPIIAKKNLQQAFDYLKKEIKPRACKKKSEIKLPLKPKILLISLLLEKMKFGS